MTPGVPDTPEALEALPLDALIATAWACLSEGVAQTTSPFRTPVFSSVHAPSTLVEADARVVVLRHADSNRRSLEFYTDVRSHKVSQLQANPTGCWVFYDRLRKLQMRIRGTCHVQNNNAYTVARWRTLEDHSKRAYGQTRTPGETVAQIKDAAPCPNLQDPDLGEKNFAIVCATIEQIEWLLLSRRGHRRAILRFQDKDWSSQWVMP